MKQALTFVMALLVVSVAHTAETNGISAAKQVFIRYLKAPYPEGPAANDPYGSPAHIEAGKARDARVAILSELQAMPEEAVSAADEVLRKQADPKQRLEIVGMLEGSIHTRQCAELLCRILEDVREPEDKTEALYEELVRSSAVQGLRRMARQTDRTGGKRIQRKSDLEPKVQGLVPYLISAANDKAERVRESALYALADSCDPAAVDELRKRLKDPSRTVRFRAACFLTEFQDASGLKELKLMLAHLQKTRPKNDSFQYWTNQEMLLASLERITGKSFGDIPMNPTLCSFDNGEVERYRDLLDAWSEWWDWEPADYTKQQNPNKTIESDE